MLTEDARAGGVLHCIDDVRKAPEAGIDSERASAPGPASSGCSIAPETAITNAANQWLI